MRFADRDRAGPTESSDEPGVPRPLFGELPSRSRERRETVDTVKILDRYWDAGEGWDVVVARQQLVCRTRRFQRPLCIEEFVRLQTFPELAVPIEGSCHQLRRGEFAAPQGGSDVGDGA